jgi:8-oxo-dGTP pyrophosphatase MutT (NUDIX family)
MDKFEWDTICGVVIEKDGKILLVQEGKQSAKGLWNIPGGHLDPHEDIFDAARREASEEAGVKIKLDNFLGVYYIPRETFTVIRLIFIGHIISGEPKPQEGEILAVKWVTPDEGLALNEKLRGIKQALGDYKKGIRYPLDVVKRMQPWAGLK